MRRLMNPRGRRGVRDDRRLDDANRDSDEEGAPVDRRGNQDRNCCMAVLNWIKVACLLVFYCIMSLHHDWINPRLQEFDRNQA